MDKALKDLINTTIEWCFTRLDELAQQYGIPKGEIDMGIYTTKDLLEDSDLRECLGRFTRMESEMFVVMSASMDPDDIIDRVYHSIYLSYEDLLLILLGCRCNKTDIFKYLEYDLKHEIGHSLCFRKEFIGQYYDEEFRANIDARYANNVEFVKRYQKLDENTSYEERLKFVIDYHNELPDERAANEAVGLTEADITEHFYLVHR